MYEEMIDFVKNYLESTNANATELPKAYTFRNRFDHSMRVYEWAKRINQIEGGDKEIVEIAAIFHDVGKGVNDGRPHAESGSEICEKYLKEINFDEEKIKRIVQAIKVHSYKEEIEMELSLDDKILMDADTLDEVGALLVLWDSIDSGKEENASYINTYHRINKHFENRKREINLLRTKEGKRLYQERLDCLQNFMDGLKLELFLL